MLSAMILAALALSLDDVPRSKPRPTAMVLDLEGKVEIRPAKGPPKSAEPGDLLYPGERLAVPAGGNATISILGAGARETIKPQSEVTAGPEGCSPPESIATRKELPKAVAATMKSLRPSPGDGRKAGVGFRSGRTEMPVTPIPEATIPDDRPSFAWPPSPGATRYRLALRVAGAEEPLWIAEATSPSLPYPEGQVPLGRGQTYSWAVTDDSLRKAATGTFSVASAAEASGLAEAAALRASDDRADRFLAVLCYRHLHAYREAIEAAEDLSGRWPEEPAYRHALAELLRIAGRAEGR